MAGPCNTSARGSRKRDWPSWGCCWRGFLPAAGPAVLHRLAQRRPDLPQQGGVGRQGLLEMGFAAKLVDAVLAAYRRSRFKWRPTVIARVSASCVNVDRILPRNPR